MTGALQVVPPSSSATGTRLVMVPPPAGKGQKKPKLQDSDPAMKRQLLRLSPGHTIPGTSWRISRWLGEGNMGVVYEARHVEIDRRAAIKVVAASLADDPAAVADFRSEASASAKIGSPNIVDVFDFAVLNDGRLMMAMEFVPGRSLYDIHLAEGRFAADRLIGLFRQVCKGLQAAHEAGLVHRDIKPENIMVGDIGGRRDTVKLVDFGIATILGERSSRHAGTPYYMPPEGLLGGEVDGRYDVYSVGCVMFELLTGKPPFVHRDLERVLEMHLSSPVPDLICEEGAVPRKLAEVVRRCLAKTPSERFESMSELEAALCEAQIDAKLRTTWDDLPLPAIDPDRRQKLLARMPARVVKRGVSGWWIPVLLGLGVAAGAVIAWPMMRTAPVVTVERSTSEVDALVGRIHESAALAYYVYPPVDDPRADTAYKLLVQLEALDGDEGASAADDLRAELAATLVRLGDEIWEQDGGEPFALDFYVQAIMFDPSIEPARTRASMSPGELLALRRKAGAGDFTESELIAVEPLQALAEPDVVEKQEKLETIKKRRRNHRSASATAQLDQLIANEPSPPVVAAAAAEANAAADTSAELNPEADTEFVGATETETETETETATVSKKGNADAIVAEADAARKAAKLADAAALYHKALRIEQHRVDALSGLARVYFEQANYAKSVSYYEMAVKRSSSNAELRIGLGDAFLKTLDYEQALIQYTKAKQLGSAKADKRIARVEAQTGG